MPRALPTRMLQGACTLPAINQLIPVSTINSDWLTAKTRSGDHAVAPIHEWKDSLPHWVELRPHSLQVQRGHLALLAINYQLTHSTSALTQLSYHNATGDRINILHAGKGDSKAVGCCTHGATFHPTTALHGNCCWGIVDMPGWAFHKRHWVCQQQQASRTFQHENSSTADNQPIHTPPIQHKHSHRTDQPLCNRNMAPH